jgi:glucose/arabinose dehydrogenase
MVVKSGTRGADRLNGTAVADELFGKSGGDTARGGTGRDSISGGEGRDKLYGGAGDDVIFGFGANDAVAGSGNITATRIATGLGAPVFATSAPGDPDRLFVVEKGGTIKILDLGTGTTNAQNFLTIPSGQIETDGEQGLLGLAFHPDYATNGKFYIYMTNAAGDIEVRQYLRSSGNPDLADQGSGDLILTIPHPGNSNHNGGWIAFGPDGMLYIAVGDGGGGGDAPNNAQNKGVLLGKMLRIDVDGDDFAGDPDRDYAIPDDNPFAGATPGMGEIWATGLRNPWRPSFDRVTGDLYIADVGQDKREEVNFQPGNSNGGENYGWAVKEGDIPFDPGRPGNPGPNSPALTDPLIDYRHISGPNGGFSVTGGYVYRGQSEGMRGVYFYADFASDQIWSFRVVNGKAVDAINRTEQFVISGGTIDGITSFGEDGRGNLYIMGIDGEIFLIEPEVGAGDGADLIDGGDGRDRILGGVGNDTLRGGADSDTLSGNGQRDRIVGGAGQDFLAGGGGADVFDFNERGESAPGSRRDVIKDFGTGADRLDFSTLDASPAQSGNQSFSFVGQDAFDGQGQIRAVQDGTSVIVLVNIAGSVGAEMQIVLLNTQAGDLSPDDFIL